MIEKVTEYYDEFAEVEWERLNNPYSRVEFESTMHLIKKYFPKKGKILDIGSGPGRYSLKLAEMGYQMSLLDISEKELDIAKDKFVLNNYSSDGFHCLSALELDKFKDEEFDAILLLGPMYHLHKKEDRKKVLDSVNRILKSNGVAIIAYINTLGVLKSSVFECPDVFENHTEKLQQYLKGDLSLSHEESFTSAFFTTPQHALEEIQNSKLEILSHAGAESFVSGMHLELRKLKQQSEELYNKYISMAVECCELPQYREATEHLNIVVRKVE